MPRAVQRATAADVPYSMSSGCATTQSTRWKDSSGRAGNVMSAILPERFPVGMDRSPRAGTGLVQHEVRLIQDQVGEALIETCVLCPEPQPEVPGVDYERLLKDGWAAGAAGCRWRRSSAASSASTWLTASSRACSARITSCSGMGSARRRRLTTLAKLTRAAWW